MSELEVNIIEEPTFDLSIKKKKKSTPKQKIEEVQQPQIPTQKEEVVEEDADVIVGEEVDFLAKKKRAKKPIKKSDSSADQPQQQQAENNDSFQSSEIERDYTYEELAHRVYDLILRNNPSFSSQGVKKQTIPPPIVGRGGSKITLWSNFMEICEAMSRKPDHVLSFVLAELGTDGSIDGSSRFVIKGRFQSKGIENVLRRYIIEYVACQTCNSPSTHLKKENRLQFLCCEKCGSKRSVTVVKKGFEALIGKRSKIEAKQ